MSFCFVAGLALSTLTSPHSTHAQRVLHLHYRRESRSSERLSNLLKLTQRVLAKQGFESSQASRSPGPVHLSTFPSHGSSAQRVPSKQTPGSYFTKTFPFTLYLLLDLVLKANTTGGQGDHGPAFLDEESEVQRRACDAQCPTAMSQCVT